MYLLLYDYSGGFMKKVFFVICCFINVMIVCGSDKVSVSLNKCIDGDTAKFVIDGSVKTVRFLSINTPEIAHDGRGAEWYGDEASSYTCNVLTLANEIVLEFDPKSDKTDKYGRFLAWVYVDGKLLQEDLVRNGYAQVKYVYDDYLYANDLKVLEDVAKSEGIGMWKTDSSDDSFVYIYVIVFIGCALLILYRFLNK